MYLNSSGKINNSMLFFFIATWDSYLLVYTQKIQCKSTMLFFYSHHLKFLLLRSLNIVRGLAGSKKEVGAEEDNF